MVQLLNCARKMCSSAISSTLTNTAVLHFPSTSTLNDGDNNSYILVTRRRCCVEGRKAHSWLTFLMPAYLHGLLPAD